MRAGAYLGVLNVYRDGGIKKPPSQIYVILLLKNNCIRLCGGHHEKNQNIRSI